MERTIEQDTAPVLRVRARRWRRLALWRLRRRGPRRARCPILLLLLLLLLPRLRIWVLFGVVPRRRARGGGHQAALVPVALRVRRLLVHLRVLHLRGRRRGVHRLLRRWLAVVGRAVAGRGDRRRRGAVRHWRTWLLDMAGGWLRGVSRCTTVRLALRLRRRWLLLLLGRSAVRWLLLLLLLLLVQFRHIVLGHPACGVERDADDVRARRALVMGCLLRNRDVARADRAHGWRRVMPLLGAVDRRGWDPAGAQPTDISLLRVHRGARAA